jgi:hypothetical protein
LYFSLPARALVGVSLFGIVAAGLVSPAVAAPERLTAPSVQQQEAAPAPDPVSEAEKQAVRQAAATGSDVVVEALTTPTELVTASPDGSFSKTLTVEPSRMLHNGKWVDISTDVVDAGDVLRPKMAPVDLSLGKGKSRHMSTVGDSRGHSVTESWPYGELPVPVLKANTATYPGVLPGVDLIQVVKKQGISQVLKISTPEAARDPRVQELKLKLDSTNVTFAEDGKGGLTGKSAKDGTDVLRSATGQWWDSRYPDASATDPGGPGLTRPLKLSLTKENGQVHEKLALNDLTTAKDLTYPLYVDPDWSAVRASYVFVDSAFPNTSYWNGQYTEGYVNVGFLPGKWDYSYGLNHSTRGYWQFNTGPLVGKRIFSARFNATNIWSSSCTARTVRARVTGGVGPGTTWNAQPGIVADLDAKAFAYGNEGAGCGDSTVAFDMMAGAHIFPTVGQWTVGLFADNEHWDELSWKRFRNDASITISYGTPPSVPQLTNMTYCSYKCPSTGPQPGLTRFPTPTFTMYASDPDGNADGNLAIYAAVRRAADDSSVWEMYQGPLWVPGTGGYANWGANPTNPPLADGKYYFIFHAQDNTGLATGGGRYYFDVDTSAPPAPTIASASASLGLSMSDPAGVVGQTPYSFTLTNPSADPVKGFIYAMTSSGVTPAHPADMTCDQRVKEYTMICPADGKTASFTAAAISRENTKITAWAVDEAGNVGTFKKTLNGSTAAFTVGNHAPMPSQALPATASGTATALSIPGGTDGPSGTCTDIADDSVPAEFKGAALGLQGGYASTTTSAADTANSFTVSGWFCPTTAQGTSIRPVIAQTDSAGTVLAELRINTTGKWELATRTTAGATETVTAAGASVAAGSWYFVNAVYDKINRQLRITYATTNNTETWTVATTSDTHAPAPVGSKVLLGASSTTAGTPRFTGLLAGPALTTGVLVDDQIKSLWARTDPTTVTVLK